MVQTLVKFKLAHTKAQGMGQWPVAPCISRVLGRFEQVLDLLHQADQQGHIFCEFFIDPDLFVDLAHGVQNR